jgi:hypothetical protein
MLFPSCKLGHSTVWARSNTCKFVCICGWGHWMMGGRIHWHVLCLWAFKPFELSLYCFVRYNIHSTCLSCLMALWWLLLIVAYTQPLIWRQVGLSEQNINHWSRRIPWPCLPRRAVCIHDDREFFFLSEENKKTDAILIGQLKLLSCLKLDYCLTFFNSLSHALRYMYQNRITILSAGMFNGFVNIQSL